MKTIPGLLTGIFQTHGTRKYWRSKKRSLDKRARKIGFAFEA
jgi:hypothetical protein